jgi:hypothetical protein
MQYIFTTALRKSHRNGLEMQIYSQGLRGHKITEAWLNDELFGMFFKCDRFTNRNSKRKANKILLVSQVQWEKGFPPQS